ncbi:glycosyltransferase family 4 protein [Erysipelothrix sp. HDW6C]|uniref:glycosyltransferase n=1 Tax=Erysipelothrix sp. HDW6C TaxID=2714930 RepID=UPI00140B1D91|nr:glycosyltransferase [Erysipelothrix sp. HDW6C]QIK70030.1 glycosyltransferase family 4 protein [Erysipelothrix sp. HDW6C]
MKKISVYVRNKEITPSSYYRIVQYFDKMDDDIVYRNATNTTFYRKYLDMDKSNRLKRALMGMAYYVMMVCKVTASLIKDLIRKPDIIVVSKTFIPRRTPAHILFLLKQNFRNSVLFWDFDDAIFESGEISSKQAVLLSEKSSRIVVTSEYLKAMIAKEYQSKVDILPTTDGDFYPDSLSKLNEVRRQSYDSNIKLVWVATSSNLPNLLHIAPALDQAAKEIKTRLNKSVELITVCNRGLDFDFDHIKYNDVRWTRDKAIAYVHESHIGIMPLMHNSYAKGKGGFKLIQYLSAGLPILGSNVGYNNEVITNENGILVDDTQSINTWVDAVINVSTSYDAWERMSNEALKSWETSYSYSFNFNYWVKLISSGGF